MKRRGSGSEFVRWRIIVMAMTATLVAVVAGIATRNITSVEMSVVRGQPSDIHAADGQWLDVSIATARDAHTGDVHDVLLEGGVVYVAVERTTATLDVSDPRHPVSLGQVELEAAPRRIAIVGMGSDLSAITLFTLGADGRSLEHLGTPEPGVPDFGPLPFGVELPWAGTGR